MLTHILPEDPALTIPGGLAGMPTEAQIQRARESSGLGLPIDAQFRQGENQWQKIGKIQDLAIKSKNALRHRH